MIDISVRAALLRMLDFAPIEAKATWRAGPLPPVQHAWTAPPVPQPKTTLQRIREPVAHAAQRELPLQQSSQ